MKGVSAIVVIILILLITVSLAALAYTFFTGMITTATEETEEALEHTTSSMLGQVKIDSIKTGTAGNANVSIRNIGGVDLDDCSVYVNDDIDNGATDPGTVSPGEINFIEPSVTINSGDKVKVTCNPGAIATRTA